MSLLSKLFGSKPDPEPESVDYNGFAITPAPMREGSSFRLSAKIEKDGKSHTLIRADTFESVDAASDASVAKARQMIDEQGDRLFT